MEGWQHHLLNNVGSRIDAPKDDQTTIARDSPDSGCGQVVQVRCLSLYVDNNGLKGKDLLINYMMKMQIVKQGARLNIAILSRHTYLPS
jgi:hypothetical protein